MPRNRNSQNYYQQNPKQHQQHSQTKSTNNQLSAKQNSQMTNNIRNNTNQQPSKTKPNTVTPQMVVVGQSPQATDPNEQKLVSQRIKFAIEDAQDYLSNHDFYDISPSRREAMIDKGDTIIERLQSLCTQYLIGANERDQIRDLIYKLERRANNLCCLDDDWQDGVIEETEDEEDEEDEESDEEEIEDNYYKY